MTSDVFYLKTHRTIDLQLPLTSELGKENLESLLIVFGERMVENINTLDPIVRDEEELKKVNEKNIPIYSRYKLLEIILSKSEAGKPMILQLRPKDYFKPGDLVQAFVFEPFERKVRFEPDEVEKITEYDYTQAVGLKKNGSPYLYSMYLMHDWEFKFLKQDKNFRKLWIDYSRPVVTDNEDVLYTRIFQFFEAELRKASGEKKFVLKPPRILEGAR
ncbi:MAG: hypothetical protein GOU97_03950 [Nanoarchaeota archaeon]|nr:hypothetical protein [Nanoarchaeota archaeon]